MANLRFSFPSGVVHMPKHKSVFAVAVCSLFCSVASAQSTSNATSSAVLPATQAQTAENNRPNTQVEFPPGFKVLPSSSAHPTRPAQANKPDFHPVPLTDQQIMDQLVAMGMHPESITVPHGVYTVATPTLSYEFEGQDLYLDAEISGPTYSFLVGYGTPPQGYIGVYFQPTGGSTYLLDCSVEGGGQSFSVSYQFARSDGYPTGNQVGGTVLSFNNHLLVPISAAPPDAAQVQVTLTPSGLVRFAGCQIDAM